MGLLKFFSDMVYNLIKRYRLGVINRLLDPKSKTLLDIGCQDLFFYNRLKDKFRIVLADKSPKNDLIKKEDVQKLSFKNKSFDIVLCMEVLEHVPDPVKAILELKRLTKKQLIISVPNEPFFTLFRLLSWDKEHLWAITPKVLKSYLGNPVYEKKVFLRRYFIAVWRFD